MNKITWLLVSLTLITQCWGAAPLSSEEEVEKVYGSSDVVIEAKVISKFKIWTLGGSVISEEEAFEIEKEVLKFQEEFMELFGLANEDSPEARKHMDKWLETEVGKKSQKKIECLILATFSVGKVVKGERISSSVVTHSTWSSGILQTCSDVGVNTEVDSKVLLFLKDKEIERGGPMQVGYNSLLIGPPTKK